MYFTPDGKSAIVVAEARKRLDFLDPQTMQHQVSVDVPNCGGVNHADFSIDGKFAIFTCEFQGSLVKVDIVNHTVLGYLTLSGGTGAMPQDIRVSPDGSTFYVAEMMRGGVYTIDPYSFTETGFIPTGIGTHGLYPSRDGTKLYVANRGQDHVGNNTRNGPGSVSVIDFATKQVVVTWPIPGGGSPDMGNVSADGGTLWLSGRYDDVVYAINTINGERHQDPRRPGTSRPRGLAPTRPLLPRPHRQHAVAHHATRRHQSGVEAAQVTPVRWCGVRGGVLLSGSPSVQAAGSPGSQGRLAPSSASRFRASCSAARSGVTPSSAATAMTRAVVASISARVRERAIAVVAHELLGDVDDPARVHDEVGRVQDRARREHPVGTDHAELVVGRADDGATLQHAGWTRR